MGDSVCCECLWACCLAWRKRAVSRGEGKDVFLLEEINPSKCLGFLQLPPEQTKFPSQVCTKALKAGC